MCFGSFFFCGAGLAQGEALEVFFLVTLGEEIFGRKKNVGGFLGADVDGLGDGGFRGGGKVFQGGEGFLQLDTVLSPAKTSIEELREEAFAEKYGI